MSILGSSIWRYVSFMIESWRSISRSLLVCALILVLVVVNVSAPIISLVVSVAPRNVERSILVGRAMPRLPCFSDSGLVLLFCMSSGSMDVLEVYSMYMFSMLAAVVGSLSWGLNSGCVGFAAWHIFIILLISYLRVPGDVCCSCVRYLKKLLGMGFCCALEISSCGCVGRFRLALSVGSSGLLGVFRRWSVL